MKERLIQLMDTEQLTSSKFADIIGVQRSSVSHILSGRNKPSFDFIQKILDAFPDLSASWLLRGKGAMFEHGEPNYTGTLFREENRKESSGESASGIQGSVAFSPGGEEKEAGKEIETKEDKEDTGEEQREEDTVKRPGSLAKKQVVNVILFFADGTFTSFEPSE